VLVTTDHVFVGYNAGEWGGGLRRIDRRTGHVEVVARNVSGELCGGPLNTGCDPVNGIVTEPWKPECVVVAVGLVHMSPHGRLVQVCGPSVQRLLVRPYGDESPRDPTNKDDEPFSTVAFFGLARAGDVLWAVGIDGLYQVGVRGAVKQRPLPAFTNVGGVEVSFAIPHMVLVLTRVNQRRSASGNVPMLVPR
jgi:hypothetical protein